MATTIRSTSLDFNSIKNNLKTFLLQKDEFKDFNFEASALSNLLDVLAYNTHYNGLIANFALNESFLTTAQLRSSALSIAEGMGYLPKSVTASKATVNISLTNTTSGRDSVIEVEAGLKFNGTINNTQYVFQTLNKIRAEDDGSGLYRFYDTETNSFDIPIYEGSAKTKTFRIDDISTAGTVYVIPDQRLDTATVSVKVYESFTGASYRDYQNILNATEITDQTSLYVLREAPNGEYELVFGAGNILGITPEPGNKAVISYLRPAGAEANGIRVFIPQSTVTLGGSAYTLSVTRVSESFGGSEKEDIESIRKNAPYQYSTQNRMVTANDYTSIAFRNYSPYISDIQSFGGQDAEFPEFGVVFMCIKFVDGTTDANKALVRNGITELANNLAVLTFDVKFIDPVITYVESDVYFQFNPDLTTYTVGRIRDDVKTTVLNYYDNNIGNFLESFRRSNMLSLVDDVSPAVLSSRADIRIQQRITPTLNTQRDYVLNMPVPIAAPDKDTYVITSTLFNYANSSYPCIIKNKLGTNILQIIAQDSTSSVIVDNAGNYTAATGRIELIGFKPSSILGGTSKIKIKAVPSNQSAISPIRNNILEHDESQSVVTAVIVQSTW